MTPQKLADRLGRTTTPARPAPKGPVDDRTIGNDGRYLGRQPWPAVPFCICQWHHSADTGQRRPRARASRCSKSRAGLRRSGRRSRSLWDRRCWLSDLSAGQIDTAGQCEKQAFLAQPGATAASDYLQASLHDPISPYQVKAGTVIPAVMVGGINSDVPGMIVGQVADNVYDTATGRYLLISQGAKLIGAYDNSVSQGQTRVVVIWNHIIYPDASSMDLGSMPGADEGGYAGFHDQVNTHL